MLNPLNAAKWLGILILAWGYPVNAAPQTPVAQAEQPTISTITAIESSLDNDILQLRLQTSDQIPLKATTTPQGNTLIIEVENAQLSSEFRRPNPIEGITSITARNRSATRVQIEIIGQDSLPIATLSSNLPGLLVEVETAQSEEEVVVTAEKRPERAQDVPISLTVLPRQQLEDAQVNSLEGIAALTPNFSTFGSGSSNFFTIYSVRGLGNSNFLSRDAVGFYIDDVPYDYAAFLDFNLFDLEQAEVLRGPQSTLYGRNSQSGVVNITTRRPTNKPEISLGGSYGNENRRSVQLSLSDAIIPDQLAFRLSGSYQARDGYYDNRLVAK